MMKNELFHFNMCGLDNVYLLNGYTITNYGDEEAYSFHDVDGLHAAIAHRLVNKNGLLSNKEFRFLRLELEMSQSAMGNILGVTEQAVRKWEKGENNISRQSDALIRMMYLESLNEESRVTETLNKLRDIDQGQEDREYRFQETDEGWSETY